MTKASVVILTRNSEDWLIDVLESVSAQTCPRDWLETTIVDRGSTDATTALARFYMARHGMRGGLHAADPALGLAGAMNVGWQTAIGDWIQVIKSPGRLAPDKIEAQLDFVAQLSQSTRAVFCKWQSLRKNDKAWLASGPVNQVAIPAPPYLRLVAPHAPPLGAALLRKKALAEAGGFPEALSFAGDENLLLRIAGMHENTRASRGRFVVAPSATPLYFEREAAAPVPPLCKAGFAREHLDNLMIARAMLRDHQLGMLTLEETREIAKLCAESLRDLERYDRRTFKQCTRMLREIDPGLIAPTLEPSPSLSAQDMAPAVGLAPTKTAGPRALAGRSPPATLDDLDDTLERIRHKMHLRRGVRARRQGSRAVWMAGMALSAAAVAALFYGATDFTGSELREGYANLLAPKPSSEGPLSINVAPTVYAEPMSLWPMPVLVRGDEELPAGAALHVRGLPVSVTLSEGRRTAPDTWSVPLPAVSRLEILVGAPIPGRSDLLLTLASAEGNVLAEARAVLAVAEALPTARPDDRAPSKAPGQLPRPPETAPGTAAAHQAPRQPANARAIATWAPVGANDRAIPAVTPKDTEGAATAPSGSPTVDKELPAREPVLKTVVARSTTTAPVLLDATAAQRTERVRESPKSQSITARSTRGSGSEPSQLTGNSRRLAETMVARGERELSQGNVSGARQFLLRAAETGLARAALLLGSTYDQHEFARLQIQGVQPNPSLARKWYLRAQELGEADAGTALLRLSVSD